MWQANVILPIPPTSVYLPIANANVNHDHFQFCFFFSGNTNDIDKWYIDNVSLYIPYEHNIRAEQILTGSQYVAGVPFVPSFKIRNIGKNTETFPAVFRVYNYSNSLVYEDTKTVSNLAMDSTRTVNFTAFSAPEPDAHYRVEYFTDLADDEDQSNDTLTGIFETYTHVKQQVVMEIATGTWCYYCPGASMGAEDLLAHGDSVAVIEYHGNDPFTTPASTGRIQYYQVAAYPTSIFGGVQRVEGGAHNTSMYPDYLPLYRQQIAAYTPLQMYVYGTNSGSNYSVDVNIQRVGQIIDKRTVLHLVLSESHIYYPWEGKDSLQYVFRMMVPDVHGTPVDMTAADSKTIHLDFTLNPAWNPKNLQICTFIQDTVTHEIFNGNKLWLSDLVLTGVADLGLAAADRIGTIWPNPFSSVTSIPVYTMNDGEVSAEIFSMIGCRVRNLFNGRVSEGRHDLSWDGTGDNGNRVPNGFYFIRILKDGRSFTKKIMVDR